MRGHRLETTGDVFAGIRWGVFEPVRSMTNNSQTMGETLAD